MQLIHLSAVRRLVDITEEEGEAGSSSTVAVVCRQTEDLRERCYTLQLVVDSQV